MWNDVRGETRWPAIRSGALRSIRVSFQSIRRARTRPPTTAALPGVLARERNLERGRSEQRPLDRRLRAGTALAVPPAAPSAPTLRQSNGTTAPVARGRRRDLDGPVSEER